MKAAAPPRAENVPQAVTQWFRPDERRIGRYLFYTKALAWSLHSVLLFTLRQPAR